MTGDGFRQDFGSKGVFGFQLGALQQVGAWVVGLEGGYSRVKLHATSNDPFDIAGAAQQLTYETRLNWFATITPRLGYAFGSWQVYGKGGLAAARSQASFMSTGGGVVTFQEYGIHVGWTAGAGIEYALTPNWILGVEYNHYDFGSETFGGVMRRNGRPDEGGQYALSLRADSVTARLSYLWALDGTIPARASYGSAGATKTIPILDRGWAGLYVGAHGGYGWANAENAHPNGTGFVGLFSPDPTMAAAFDQSLDGWMAGGHVGMNYQAGQWVLGVEAAATGTRLKGKSTGVLASLGADAAATYETKLDWLATLTPRVGWDAGNWMPYVKGGLAMGRIESSLNTSKSFGPLHPGPQTFNEANHHLGWTAGAGIEYRLSPNWIAGLEYNYVDLDAERYGGLAANGKGKPIQQGEYDVGLTMHALLARLSFRP